ncbi:phage baseplate plug family protein [Acetobacter tropicalis]|uniref:Cyanophage baseplate Pam3 plug gp18 domain-containing protein n=1 Tax=Acetobacter tropicalis TaxID=104102 RepID=A0A094YX31_9PROT|nr:hypothetical protein [Acetobacter tropicalis]KGB25219.1 hypothetical protein AtDm6_0900 [Acetobacter tropicalis]MDO8171097.1 hypothetical protein [Acetobacter tropicalis]
MSSAFFTISSTTDLVMIPLATTAAQMLKVTLSGQSVQIALRQRSTGLYADFWLENNRLLSGILCQDRTWLARDEATGLPGDFTFTDTQGTQNPTYEELGSRYLLFYRVGWL